MESPPLAREESVRTRRRDPWRTYDCRPPTRHARCADLLKHCVLLTHLQLQLLFFLLRLIGNCALLYMIVTTLVYMIVTIYDWQLLRLIGGCANVDQGEEKGHQMKE